MLSWLVMSWQNKDWVNSAAEIYILEVLEVGSPRSRSQHSQRVPFLTSRQPPSNCVFTWWTEKASFLIPLLLRTLILPDQGPILMTLPNFNYLSKASSSSNIWLWVNNFNTQLLGGHSSVHSWCIFSWDEHQSRDAHSPWRYRFSLEGECLKNTSHGSLPNLWSRMSILIGPVLSMEPGRRKCFCPLYPGRYRVETK